MLHYPFSIWANWDSLKLDFLWVAWLECAQQGFILMSAWSQIWHSRPLPQAGSWDGDGKPGDLIFGLCFIQMWTPGTTSTPLALPPPEPMSTCWRLVYASEEASLHQPGRQVARNIFTCPDSAFVGSCTCPSGFLVFNHSPNSGDGDKENQESVQRNM